MEGSFLPYAYEPRCHILASLFVGLLTHECLALVLYDWQTAHHLMAVWKQGTAVVYNRPVTQRDWRTHILWEPQGRGAFGWTVPGWDGAYSEMGWIYMFVTLLTLWRPRQEAHRQKNGEIMAIKAKGRKRRGWLVWWNLIYVIPSPSFWQICLCFTHRIKKSQMRCC